MFNEHDKLDFALKLTKSLLQLFKGTDEISKRVADDAKALQEMASNRSMLASQFQEFNLNGNSFSLKGKSYSTKNIIHIGFHRAVTTHKTNFMETGKTEEVHIYLTMLGGQEVRISVNEQGVLLNRDKSEQIKRVVEFYSYLSQVTFDKRVSFYETQIQKKGYFEYDKCFFYPPRKIMFHGQEFDMKTTSFFRRYGNVEMRKKNFGILDRIKREVSFTKIPQFSTLIDTDVIFHLLEKHFSLRWNS
jgi:hypothetical protein